MLLMGDQSTVHQTAETPEPVDETDDDGGPPDSARPDEGLDPVLIAFRQDCGLHSPFEVQVLSPGQTDWQSSRFNRPFVMIGRDPLCDLVLDHDDVSRRHACIQIVNGIPTICDLGSRHGICKEGRHLQKSELRRNDTVELGPISIRVVMPEDASAVSIPRAERIALDFVNHRRRAKGGWVVDQSVTIIGASKPSKVRLEHPSVSRVHCMLVRASRWWLVNLGSQVGTLIDEKYVEFAPISIGTVLRVGNFRIRAIAPLASDAGGDTSILRSAPGSGSARLSELTRSTLASRGSRSRRSGSGIPEELVVELFREFATLHDRTLTQLQQTFREMLDVAVGHRGAAAASPASVLPRAAGPVAPEPRPLEEDAPNLAVVNLSMDSSANSRDEDVAAHARLTAKLMSIEENMDYERKSLARRLLKTLSLGR
jgi:pSer/pThr/pTyr-binding forkhead associated (FHA) protein